MLKLYNSRSRQIEDFKPIRPDLVGFYSCGPTVYNYIHIGNLRSFLLADLVRRALKFNSLPVKFVMNITDVGHLTSDSDTGDDKLEKNARTLADVQMLAKKYTDAFLSDLTALNIDPPDVLPRASEHVPEQIEMVRTLIDKGFAYESDEAVYFDVAKFPDYNQLTGQKLDDMMLGARQEVVKDPRKKNPIDFVLWFKAVGRYQNHIQRWDSPWGVGFPGWHIECSAMSRKYLGNHFDIHAGGIDLKFPHHTNEIAQSEAANGEPFVNVWLHGEHLSLPEGKMSKSEGNSITLATLIDKGFSPLAFRYLALTAHYRAKLNFTWDGLQAAQNALNNLYSIISDFTAPAGQAEKFEQAFLAAINSDLGPPQALAVMWDLVKTDEVSDAAKLASLFKFDEVLGLKLKDVWTASQVIPEVVINLASERETARRAKDYVRSDELRRAIESNGYFLEDSADGFRLKKKF